MEHGIGLDSISANRIYRIALSMIHSEGDGDEVVFILVEAINLVIHKAMKIAARNNKDIDVMDFYKQKVETYQKLVPLLIRQVGGEHDFPNMRRV